MFLLCTLDGYDSLQLDSVGFIPGLDFTEKSDQTMLPWQFSSAKYET